VIRWLLTETKIYLFIVNFYVSGTAGAFPGANAVGAKADHSPYLVQRWERVKLYFQTPYAFMAWMVTFTCTNSLTYQTCKDRIRKSVRSNYQRDCGILASDTGNFSLKSKYHLLPTPTLLKRKKHGRICVPATWSYIKLNYKVPNEDSSKRVLKERTGCTRNVTRSHKILAYTHVSKCKQTVFIFLNKALRYADCN
jgi:hypothetical protein